MQNLGKVVITMQITKMNLILNEDCSTKLIKEYSKEYTGLDNLDTPEKVADVMNKFFGLDKQAEEYLYLISMTAKCKPIGFFEVTHGTCNASMVGIREILIRALLSGAVNIIIAHNHPSGISEASEQDLLVTQRLSEASNLIGLQFVDHIIIGKDNYYSFHQNKMLSATQNNYLKTA